MQFKSNSNESSAHYWDDLAELYQKETRISTNDFHYGPLLPGDLELKLLPARLRQPALPKLRRPGGSGAEKTPDEILCLEIGCGAGQNSIFLAKQGAQCTAFDTSEKQLTHGRKLAAVENVEVGFRRLSMDSMGDLGTFDLIHSTYALPFSANPQKVIADAAAMLRPSGIFLLTVGHPLYAGEWLEAAAGEEGLFLPDYFHPEPDERSTDNGTTISAQYWPLSQTAEWIREAGLIIEQLLEPQPLPISKMSEAEIRERVPYESDDWRALYPQLARVPVVAIFKCRR